MLKSTPLVSLFLSLSINFAHASALESFLIEGVKFLDDAPRKVGKDCLIFSLTQTENSQCEAL